MSDPNPSKRARREDNVANATSALLGWSAQQGRILTANGKAAEYYDKDRGFAFEKQELPHYYLINHYDDDKKEDDDDNSLWQIWKTWRNNAVQNNNSSTSSDAPPLVIGAWRRPLFYGGWEHSSDATEHVFNVQTANLFVDLRLPTGRQQYIPQQLANGCQSLDDLPGPALRLYARQHCFAGYSKVQPAAKEWDKIVHLRNTNGKGSNTSMTTTSFDQVCARHHVLDWNFVGTPRNRPNKWWIQVKKDGGNGTSSNVWKEWAYATDECGQHYYCERWERLPSSSEDDDSPTKIETTSVTIDRVVLALYHHNPTNGETGIIVVAHDHFNYCRGKSTFKNETAPFSSLAEIVDDCVARGDLTTARKWLGRLQGGHGRVQAGWKIDAAVEFWKQGTPLWVREDVKFAANTDSGGDDKDSLWFESCTLKWKTETWHVFDCNLASAAQLEQFLEQTWPN